MSAIQKSMGSAMPTLRAAAGMGGMEIEMLPIINVAGTSLPVPRSVDVSNSTIGLQPVLRMKGLGDIYGMDKQGDVIVVRHSTSENFIGGNSTLGLRETRTVSRRTKTTTAVKAKETDNRVVNLGLFVALLGVLSIIV